MSQHPSLKVDSVGVKHRNVLKRFERLKKMKASETWSDEASIYNLPKLKSIKLKVKKGGGRKEKEDEKDKGKKGK